MSQESYKSSQCIYRYGEFMVLEKDYSDLIGESIGVDWEEVKRSRERRKEDEEREELLLRH